MKNGFFSKAAAGFGKGLAQAGFMGYQEKLSEKLATKRAQLLDQRDLKLNGYNTSLQDARLGSAEGIADDRNATSTENANIAAGAARARTLSSSESARLDREQDKSEGDLDRKQDKEQAALDRTADTELQKGKPIRMNDTTVYVDGKFQFAKGAKAGPSEADKFAFQQKKALNTLLNGRHPGLFEKMGAEDKKEYQALFIEAAANIDKGMNYNVAFDKSLKVWLDEKAREPYATTGDNPIVEEAATKFWRD